MNCPRVAVIGLLAGLALLTTPVGAAAVIPFDVQVPLVLKALTYDRNLKARAGDQVRIAIIVPAKGSRTAADELQASLSGSQARTVNGMPVAFKLIVAEADDSVEQGLRDGGWAAAYIMPGFSRAELDKVRKACEQKRVLAVAAAVDDIDNGLAFGIGAQGSKPQIVINLKASKACGSDFDLALLQLSKIVQ
jgi:hypothetical protein